MSHKLAYLAGIIDGEGHIRIHNSARIHVTNTDEKLIMWLQENYPGYIWKAKNTKKPNHKPMQIWEISGKFAVEILYKIRKYLVVKKDQADIILNFYGKKYISNKSGLKNHKQELMKLTKKGVDVMPLIKGSAAKTRKGFSENIKREMNAGKPQKQALAIAYSEAKPVRKKKKGAKKK